MNRVCMYGNLNPGDNELAESFNSQTSLTESDFALKDVSLPDSSRGIVVVGMKIKLKPRNLHDFEIPSKPSSLLDYTLKKIAKGGDSIIALIIVVNPSHKKYNPVAYAAFQKYFNLALKNFIAFAHSKSIHLEGKILTSEKVFDGLIFETEFSKASALVIGCSGWKTSMGKISQYGDSFAKELTPKCHVIALYNSTCVYTKRGEKRTLSKVLFTNSIPSDISNSSSLNSSYSPPPPSVPAPAPSPFPAPPSPSPAPAPFHHPAPAPPEYIFHQANNRQNYHQNVNRSNQETQERNEEENNESTSEKEAGGEREREFTFDELCLSTIYFDENFKLGNGGCGEVYLGILPDGKEIVIKKLLTRFKTEMAKNEAVKQMNLEVKLIRRLHHVNLVRLLGVCHNKEECLIVMEYFPNGSLADRLGGEDKTKEVLTWKQRVRIALEVSEAMKYLHFFCEPHIIHRDIKSANILLDQNLSAKVSDFGLARFSSNSYELSLASAIVGTNGYFAPDYVISGLVNESSDVYSFGVVLFELLSALLPFDSSRRPCYLAKWANKLVLNNRVFDLADPKLQGNFVHAQFESIAKIACLCTADDPLLRPKMIEIVHWLESIHYNMKSI